MMSKWDLMTTVDAEVDLEEWDMEHPFILS